MREHRIVRFGVFEVDLAAGELRKRGLRVKLQDQPFQVLALLLRHPGEIVTREELQHSLWPEGTFVEFEHGVNTAINKIRQALGDSADNPRFIETLPRKGYRFIVPVDAGGAPAVPTPAPVAVPRRRRGLVWAAVALAVAVATGAGIWLLKRSGKAPESALMAVPLTSYPGEEVFPSFSPDGTQVAFQGCPEGVLPTAIFRAGENCDIYIKQIGVEPPSRLTDTPAPEFSPAWSPDGRTIAFLRRLPPSATSFALVLIPHRGGRERVLAGLDFSGVNEWRDGPYLAWTPDSKWLTCPLAEAGQGVWALYLFSVETGERRRLTRPVAGDTAPAFSPDGRTLAFARESEAFHTSDLYLLRLGEGYEPKGEPERVRLDNVYSMGAAWTPDGSEIVFTSGTMLSYGLSRMTPSKPAPARRLPFAQDNAFAPAVSRQGNRLAYSVEREDTNIWRVDLRGPGGKPGVPVRFISSTRADFYPAYSPDGKRIAFVSNRSGANEIWVCDSDGSNPVQWTSFGGPQISAPRWSPDSQSIAFWAVVAGNQDVYVISANGGAPRRLTTEPGMDQYPYWSRDGQSLYFRSDRGGTVQIWKMPAGGGKAVEIARDAGADQPRESPDGEFVYYCKGFPFPLSVWRMPAEGGEATKVLDGVHPDGGWTLGKMGIYFITAPDEKGCSDIRLYEFATGNTRKILTIERPASFIIAVSPDDRTILYPQFDEAGSDVMLVEHFR